MKSPSVFGKATTFAGGRSERRPRRVMRTCTSTQTGFHPVLHASRVTGGVRESKRGGTSKRKLRIGSAAPARASRFTFAPLFRPARFPCPACPLEQCRVWGPRLTGLGGPDLESGCRGTITRSSLWRIETEPSLQNKEEGEVSVKSASCVATIAGQSPASGEDSAHGYVLVCRILKTRCRSRKAASGSEKHPYQSDSGV